MFDTLYTNTSIVGMAVAKKPRKIGDTAVLRILTTFNNTILTLTDLQGNTVAWTSSGSAGFKGTRKGTPYAAQQAANHLVAKAKKLGIKQIDVKIKGAGQGKEPVIRAFNNEDIKVLSIEDLTPLPHNGCRAPKKRKV